MKDLGTHALLLATAAALLGCGVAHAQAQGSTAPAPVRWIALPPRPIVTPVVSCETLARQVFDRDLASPARVLSAKIVPASSARAEFCSVKGYVAPTIQFELWLPTRGYTGRYLQGGCGGNCGMILQGLAPECDTEVAFGGAFAVGFEDSGHVGTDGAWALGGSQVREDFAYRAAHVFAAAAQRIITSYYGVAPTYRYFQGCSDGGREGMAETQRYPQDFNGVTAGSPAFAIAEAMERFIWEARWGHDASGRPIWDEGSLALLHAAVLKACDALDGVQDGQIDDARRCHYDPAALRCRAGQSTGCLTATQVNVARKFYEGPRAPDGTALFYGGEPYGGELTWAGRGALSEAGTMMLNATVRDMIYQGQLAGDLDASTWSFDLQTFNELRRRGALFDANDPDLAAFRAAGGKLILWQGAADMAAGAYGLADYYQRLRDRIGDLVTTQTFARYFMVPGVYHCGSGYVPYQEDFLGALVRWVETADAPEQILASARLPDGAVRERPLYAYPVIAHYVGRGDINASSSFAPKTPAHPQSDLFPWAGASPLQN